MKKNNAAEAVIYARYSSHSQRDVSIDQQVQACRDFAQRHEISVLRIYEDRALTGTNDKRPGFQRMVQDAKKEGWAYVIVYTLDRFARDRYDSAVYKRQLKDAGVKVLSAMENISDDPTGVLVESLLEGLAEYYSKELSRKIRRGMSDNASKCMVNGSLPLGYVRGADGRYAIHEAEAETVREIFSRVIAGDRHCEIIDDLNRRGIRTKKGREWNKSSFNKLLSNERYIGVYQYGDVRIAGGVPQIVEQHVFDAVQSRLGSKPNPRSGNTPQRRRRDNSVYLLTGKLFCGNCKSPMVGISGKSQGAEPYYYYTCKGKRMDHSCSMRNVPRDKIELFITKALRETMLTDAAIRALADAAVAYQQTLPINAEIETLQQRLKETTQAIGNVMAAIEAGIFTASTKDRLTELEREKQTVSVQLSAAKAEAEEQLTREEIIAALELFQNGDETDKDYQEALIDTFLVAAYIYDDRIRFVFNPCGNRKGMSIPLPADDFASAETCTDSPQLHQTLLYKFFGTAVHVHGGFFSFEKLLTRNNGTD